MKCSIVISFIAVYLVIIIKILKSKVALKIGHDHNTFRHFTELQVVLEFSYIVFFISPILFHPEVFIYHLHDLHSCVQWYLLYASGHVLDSLLLAGTVR